MNTNDAAQRWKRTWIEAWPRHDVDAIAALYAPACEYRALAFREPDLGIDGVRRYLQRTFDEEDDVSCRFGEPVCADGRACVEWWGSWTEGGRELTLSGVSVLRFDDSGLVIDHRDYWNEARERVEPYHGW